MRGRPKTDDDGDRGPEQTHYYAASGARRCVAHTSSTKKRRPVVLRPTSARRQVHFEDVSWSKGSPPTWLRDRSTTIERRASLAQLRDRLKARCSPLPGEREFAQGIGHFSDLPGERSKLYTVPRALGTQKMHYRGKLDRQMAGVALDGSGHFFCEALPSLQPASGGSCRVEYLDRESVAWETLQRAWHVYTVPKFLKHLCDKHNGEARLFGETSWTLLRGDVRQPRLWSHQFARTPATRKWLAQRSARHENKWLTLAEVHWVLDQCDGRTTLIRKERAASGAWRFLIRTGQVATLAQMLFHGAPWCTCYDVYKLYASFEIVVHRRDHGGTVQDRSNNKKARSGTHWWGER